MPHFMAMIAPVCIAWAFTFMHSLSPEYLDALRFDGSQVATLRSLGGFQGKQQLYAMQLPDEVAPENWSF